MKWISWWRSIHLCMFLLLTGCQIDLYSALTEQEANQMLALLIVHRLAARKVTETNGSVKLRVEQHDFFQAVEVLRQHGYPKRRYHSVNDLFPANQLVTSPAQEQSKISYLKEQRLEQLLSHMEGVIHASVSIALPSPAQNPRGPVVPSAAVFIKHSPATHMDLFITQIKSLVHHSIPGLKYDAVTVVLQPTSARLLTLPYSEMVPTTADLPTMGAPRVPVADQASSFPHRFFMTGVTRIGLLLALGGSCCFILLGGIGAWYWQRRIQHKRGVS